MSDKRIQEVASGIYSAEQRVADGKNAIIFSQRGAWAVDAGSLPEEGQAMADFIQQKGYTPNQLLLTHGHNDHVLGSAAFKEGTVIASALTPVEIRRLLPLWAQRASTTIDALADQIAWPTITFSDELTMDLGDKHLRLFPTPGHSQDGVSIYVEEEHLLIAGDAVVTGIVPAIGDGDSRVLERSLHTLGQLEIDVMIPGHGAVVRGRSEVQDWLRWLPRYLSSVRKTIQQLLALGTPDDEIMVQIGFDEFVGSRLPKEKHNMVKRHQNTVGKILQEERMNAKQ